MAPTARERRVRAASGAILVPMQEHAVLGARAWQAGDAEAALAHLTTAWETGPPHPDLGTLLALVLTERGHHERALDVLRSALEHRPDHRGLLDRLASLLLALERWAEGWAVWARSLGGAERHLRPWLAGLPHWQGEPLGSRTVTIFPHPRCASPADMVMFLRYVALVRAEHPLADIRVVSPRPLHRLLEQGCPGVRAMLPAAAASGAYAWVLLSELPLLVGDRSGPPPTAPYLTVPPDEVARARTRLGIARYHGQHVGLSVPADRADDATSPPSVRRGIPPEALAPLSGGIGWVVHPLAAGADLAELAARIGAMNLVVTADNACANLAGALGVPTWVLLPTSADWRWGPGERSAWYPSARLYRQACPGDWGAVLERVGDDLRARAR
jgi:hypothetical protein